MCFFFNDTATTEIYTLSLHDALPISTAKPLADQYAAWFCATLRGFLPEVAVDSWLAVSRWGDDGTPFPGEADRKSTRLNSSHANISYAVFCLKKKTKR